MFLRVWPWAGSIIWEHIRNATSQPLALGWGPAPCVLSSPPGILMPAQAEFHCRRGNTNAQPTAPISGKLNTRENWTPSSQSYGFSNSHVWMRELSHKEGRAPKNWWFQTVMLEKTLESPFGSKEIKPVNPKGNQPWILIGRTDAEAPILWPPGVKSWLIRKDPDAGKEWGKEEKQVTEDEMVR